MVGNRDHDNVCNLPTGLQGNIPDWLVYSRRWCQVTAYYNQELDQVRAHPTPNPPYSSLTSSSIIFCEVVAIYGVVCLVILCHSSRPNS
jgi:hypothetical protein